MQKLNEMTATQTAQLAAMRLRFYSHLMQATEAALAVLHAAERPLLRLREWAWLCCTKENLKTCTTRSAQRLT